MSTETRYSTAALAAFVLGLVQAMLAVAGWAGIFPVGIIMIGGMGILCLVVGTFALVGIHKSGGRLRGTGLAVAGLAVSLVSFAVLLVMLGAITMLER